MKAYFRVPLAFLTLAVTAVVAGGAVIVGGYYYVAPGLPQAAELRDVSGRMQRPAAIYSRDGRLIEEYGDPRTPIDYEDVPNLLIDAILAAEDEHFFEHPGVDYQGVIRAVLNELGGGRSNIGGSTITQQVAREYFLTRDRTYIRKFKEWILAVRMEREFDKREILELYLNTTFFGQRSNGVVTAAETYFGKTLDELTVSETAIIAGIPQRPSEWNPVYSVANAEARRAYVLRRMHETGAIDDRQYSLALTEPVHGRRYGRPRQLDAAYVAEMARLFLIDLVGPEAAYTGGYRVTVTVDSRLQSAANAATRAALWTYDEQHGYKGPLTRVDLAAIAEAAPEDSVRQIDAWLDDYDNLPARIGTRTALVLEADAETARLRFARGADQAIEEASIGLAAVEWAGQYVDDYTKGPAPASVADVLAPGDVVLMRRGANGEWRLTQIPEVQGAFVAADPRDGAIVALTGGFDYELNSYNRAIQARRQPGSTFKPFIYSAALENGFTPATIVLDERWTAPIVDPVLEKVYRVENFAYQYEGEVSVRHALRESLNGASMRILERVTPAVAARHVQRFGFSKEEAAPNSALVLGVGGVAPATLVAAYASFPNGGFDVDPYFIDRIEDGKGELIFEAEAAVACSECASQALAATFPVAQRPVADRNALPLETQRYPMTEFLTLRPEPQSAAALDVPVEDPPFQGPIKIAEPVITPQNAFLMSDMMREVVRRGSGARAYSAFGRNDIGGKTGTTNDALDTWFVGFTQHIVAGAWVGFDTPRALGRNAQGGRTAIPMWIDFMRVALDGVPVRVPAPPPGIVERRINPRNGLLASDGNPDAQFEYFESGKLPDREPDTYTRRVLEVGAPGSSSSLAPAQGSAPAGDTPAPAPGLGPTDDTNAPAQGSAPTDDVAAPAQRPAPADTAPAQSSEPFDPFR